MSSMDVNMFLLICFVSFLKKIAHRGKAGGKRDRKKRICSLGFHLQRLFHPYNNISGKWLQISLSMIKSLGIFLVQFNLKCVCQKVLIFFRHSLACSFVHVYFYINLYVYVLYVMWCDVMVASSWRESTSGWRL